MKSKPHYFYLPQLIDDARRACLAVRDDDLSEQLFQIENMAPGSLNGVHERIGKIKAAALGRTRMEDTLYA